jgi:adenylate cyclase
MGLEIERKFLVKGKTYRSDAYKYYDMVQGYIAHVDGRSVRIRITDNESLITIKGPTDKRGMSRFEWNQRIDRKDALELMELCQGGKIEKRRYLVHSGPHVFEVDEFHGANEGLVIAEVELSSEDEIFQKLDFIDAEVTGDHRYYNAYLTTHPFNEWNKK